MIIKWGSYTVPFHHSKVSIIKTCCAFNLLALHKNKVLCYENNVIMPKFPNLSVWLPSIYIQLKENHFNNNYYCVTIKSVHVLFSQHLLQFMVIV